MADQDERFALVTSAQSPCPGLSWHPPGRRAMACWLPVEPEGVRGAKDVLSGHRAQLRGEEPR